ncbi:MAG: glycosyltransferase family 2 protein [Thiobacillus sp.]
MSLAFSVAIPAYNSAAFIGETLEAILGQSHPAADIVVVDDGSTDNTCAIVEQFGDAIKLIRTANSGCGIARKTAIEHCTSEWIATCDSDDLWQPNHLGRRAALIKRFPEATFTFSDCHAFGPGASPDYRLLNEAPTGWLAEFTHPADSEFVLFKNAYLAFLAFNPAYVSGWVFRASTYRNTGGINPAFSRVKAEDTEFSRRFLLHPEAIVAGDLHPTWSYRRHANNTSLIQWRNIQGKARILEHHLASGLIPPALIQAVVHEIRNTYLNAFNIAFWEGYYCDARALLANIPLSQRSPKVWARAAKSLLKCPFRQTP